MIMTDPKNLSKWRKWILLIGTILVFIIIILSSFKPYLQVNVTNLSEKTTSILVYYNNQKEGILDEDNRSYAHLLGGQTSQSIRIYVPLVDSLDAIRIDFGRNAEKIQIDSIQAKYHPFYSVTLTGNNARELLPVINGIHSVELSAMDDLMLSDFEQSSWIYGENLLSYVLPFRAIDFSCIFVCLGHLCLAAICFVLGLWIYPRLSFEKRKGSAIKDNLLLAAGSIVFAVIMAYLFDQCVMDVGCKSAHSLRFEMLKVCFKPLLIFSVYRIYFWFICITFTMIIRFLGFSRSIRWRYALAGLLLLALVAGKFTGSSIGSFDLMLKGNTAEYEPNVLFGRPQGLRADEWAIEKPFYFAQTTADLPYYNENLSVESTDMVVSAFAPVRHLMILARPSHWGFLLLPVEYAFSFYWSIRIIMLFLGAYELACVLQLSKKLAVISAIALVFSPAVQWLLSQWLIDIIIAGMFLLACWDHLLGSIRLRDKLLYTIGCCLFANMYIYVMYPAAQVSCAYILLSVIVFSIWKNHNHRVFQRANIVLVVLIMASVGIMALMFVSMSSDALSTMLNTVYPGTNRLWGGISWDYELLQFINPFLSWYDSSTYLNNSEVGQFISFLPFLLVGIAIVIISIIKKKGNIEKNKFVSLFLITAVSVFLLVAEHLPEIPLFSKVFFLGMSYPLRMTYAAGFGFFWVLMILVSIFFENQSIAPSPGVLAVITLAITLITVFIVLRSEHIKKFFHIELSKIGLALLLISLATFAIFGFLMLRGGKYTIHFVYLYTALLIGSTILVNPLTSGMDSVYEKSLMQAVREIDAQQHGNWITSGNAGIGNLVTAQGVGRRSGYYYYPDIDMMNIIDPEGKYERLWNSFTAIDMRLIKGENYIESPEKNVAITIYINLDTAEKLGIQYMVVRHDIRIPQTYLDDGTLELLYKDDIDLWNIYQVNH